MTALGLHCCSRALPSPSKRGPPSAAVCRPLTTVAYPAAEHGPQARGLPQLRHVGSVAAAHRLHSAGSAGVAHGPSCSAACGILPDQGPNPHPLQWQVGSQPPRHPGSPLFFFFLNKFIYLFIYFFGCVGSSPLCGGFLQLRRAGTTLHRGARASHRRGLSCCGAQAPDAQAQQLWPTGPVAPRHVGSSQTRARTRVPCTGRQTPNHCATREALPRILIPYNYLFAVSTPHSVTASLC